MTELTPAASTGAQVSEPTRTKYDPAHSFLDFSRVGRWGTGSYVLGTILILIAWFVIGGMLTAVIAAFGMVFGGANEELLAGDSVDPFSLGGDLDFGLPPWAFMFMTLIGFLPFGAAVLLVVRYVHGRPWQSVITPFRRINWGLVAKGAAMWAVPMLGFAAIGFALGFDDMSWNYDPAKFWPFAIVVLALTFVQTSSEELFFRGYLGQWLASRRRSIFFVSLITALLFASVHIPNALLLGFGSGVFEMLVGMVPYFAIGFVLAWVSYTSGTIELALGAHFLNNLVAFLLVSTDDLPVDGALFEAGETNALGAGITGLLSCVIFWLLVRRTKGSGEPLPLAPVDPSAVTMPPGQPRQPVMVGQPAATYQPTAQPYQPAATYPSAAIYPAAAQIQPAPPNAPAAVAPPVLPPAGWYPDPVGQALRYWDGSNWTEFTHPWV